MRTDTLAFIVAYCLGFVSAAVWAVVLGVLA